jgi:NAD(P)-dependent dehydrogenase (short-subunit alcohol dehydrogenase family)
VKALIGHTGWAAGAASVIKICKAFEHRTVPAQYQFESPGLQINLAESSFVISKQGHAWPTNKNGLPRRAAINGFGFGGTDAHLVLEEFEPAYHATLCTHFKPPANLQTKFAIVGFGGLFPREDALAGDAPLGVQRFRRDQMRLPKGKRLLPDVIDHMDPSQFLALLAAGDALSALPENWRGIAGETAIVLGIESKTERGTGAGERIFRDRLRRLTASASAPDGSHPETGRLLEKVVATINRRNPPSNAYTLPGLMPNVATGRVANVFDLNGPNVVVDKGRLSLAQALAVGASFLQHGDCKMVLAGGLHAAARAKDGTGEAVALLAVATFAEAQNQGFPVLGVLDLAGPDSPSLAGKDLDLRGAEGAVEIAAELSEARRDQRAARVRLPAPRPSAPVRQPAASMPSQGRADEANTSASQVYQYVQGTPISLHYPKLVPAPATRPSLSLQNQRILFLTDDPAYWRGLEDSEVLLPFDYTVLSVCGGALRNSIEIDLDSEAASREILAGLAGKFDVILAVKTLEGTTAKGFLEDAEHGSFLFLDLLFAACRGFYDEIKQQRTCVLALCLDAFRGEQLHPYTGLIAGLLKSIARECRDSVVRILNAEERSFLSCLGYIETELGQGPAIEETCIRRRKRHTIQLASLPEASPERRPYLTSDSVVIATGGGRGVTAVMVEELLARFACNVIAVGRTDPSAAPPRILEMSDEEFAAYETRFYSEQLKLGGAKIPELKQRYGAFLAARELSQVRAACEALPGSFAYRYLDITDAGSVEALVDEVYRKHGRVDLILHGAGVQISQAVPKKSLRDFRKVVNTKLASLGLLHAACSRRQGKRPLHVHVLTSAFSYMGNDGQPDYGAANEALNRLAMNLCASPETGVWSSMAWLGWAGIGMTRGSEYAALAASRRLRGVTKEEGRTIFAEAIAGAPDHPAIVQIAEGEVAHYGVVFAPAESPEEAQLPVGRFSMNPGSGRVIHMEREISLRELPYLSDHRVNGAPTLPGAFLIAEIGAFAMTVRPDLKIAAFEDAAFHRFVRIPEDRPRRLRFEGQMREEGAEHALLNVKVYADFVHRSGAVLQKDVLQTEVSIRFANRTLPAVKNGFHRDKRGGLSLEDPYIMNGSPVSLKGRFRTMRNIVSGSDGRHADYALDQEAGIEPGTAPSIPKIMMMDSLWRFGAIVREPDNSMPVYVPVKCDVMKVHFDFAEQPGAASLNNLTFCGANPTHGDENITIGPVAALDSAGHVLLVVEGGVCRRYGTVNHANA